MILDVQIHYNPRSLDDTKKLTSTRVLMSAMLLLALLDDGSLIRVRRVANIVSTLPQIP